MDDWQTGLLALGGLVLFVLVLFAAAAVSSGFLNRDHLASPKGSLRGSRQQREAREARKRREA